MASPTPEHPRVQLVFYIVGETVEDFEAEGMEKLVADLAHARRWVLGPPEFVDEVEEGTREGDLNLPLVGGVLELHSAYPPWRERLPASVEREELEATQAVVSALTEFSRTYDLELALELDGDQIGVITAGVPDEALTKGFLGAWEGRLQAREGKQSP